MAKFPIILSHFTDGHNSQKVIINVLSIVDNPADSAI